MKKLGLKSLSVILSILMVIYLLPLTVFADSFGAAQQKDQSHNEEDVLTINSDVFELKELREESVKYFRLEDGTFAAVQYDMPVHTLDEAGEWQDIDNTLASSGSEYSTSNARVKFAKKTTGNNVLMTLHDGNYKLTMSLDGAKKKVAGNVTNFASEFDADTPKIQKVTALDKLSASILYENILDGIDLEYIAVSNNIKENIIVKSKADSYTYTFTLKLNNLTAVLENNEIVLSDAKTGETIYVIPAPYMYDAAGEYSDAVVYTLTESGNKEYKLTVSADEEWIGDEGRAFPITIDPSLNVSHSSVTTTNITSLMPSMSMSTYTFMNISDVAYGYWKTSSLPEIPSSAYITNAVIALNAEGNGLGAIGAYPVTSSWDGTLTWNKMLAGEGSFSDSYVDYGVISSGSLCEWNITNLIKEWYSGEAVNYGICFKNIDGTDVTKLTGILSTNPTLRPRLIITYKDMKGLESYWTYTTQAAGFAGTGYINNATGNLVFSIPTLTTTDFLLPFTPTLVYNSSLGNTYATSENAETSYKYPSAGYGFKWNMCETLIQKHYYNENGVYMTYYIWSDSDGTEHAFMPTGTANVYKDEDGLLLTLVVNGNDTYTMIDQDQNQRIFARRASSSYFEEGAILQYIFDASGNAIEFTYDTYGRVNGIGLWPYGQNRIDMLKLSYNAQGMVNRVYNEATGESVIFYYSSAPSATTQISTENGGYLRKIVRAHHTGDNDAADWTAFMSSGAHAEIETDATASYTYGSANRMIGAKDEDTNYQLIYTYNMGKQISSVLEVVPSTGQKISFTYGSSYTEIRSSGTDDYYGSSDDLVNRYTFDSMGRTKGAYTTDVTKSTVYGGSSAVYEDSGNAVNSIKTSSYLGGTTPNLLVNGGFEQLQFFPSLMYWNTTSNVSKVSYDGNHVASFEPAAGVTDSISQYVFLPAGEYTFSMLYTTFNCGRAEIKIKADSLSRNMTYSESVPVNEHYTDANYSGISMRITAGNISNGGEQFKISVEVTGKTGLDSLALFEVDNLLLEENIAPTRFSLVQLGGFDSLASSTSNGNKYTPLQFWINADSNAIVSAEEPFGNVLRIQGFVSSLYVGTDYSNDVIQAIYTAPDAEIAEYNAAKVYEPQSFQVSGFAKGTHQLMNASSKFGITISVKYYQGAGNDPVVNKFHFAFEPGSTDWQYVSGAFTTEGGAGMLVHEITVSCEYTNHPGTAYFDNISVYPCDNDSVQENEYYEDGRLKLSRSGSYMEFYAYDEGATEDDEDGPRPKVYTTVNNRGDYIEYHYNDEDDEITNSVQKISRYRYTGNFAYESENFPTNLNKNLLNETTFSYNQYGQVTSQIDRYWDNILQGGSLFGNHLGIGYAYETTEGSRIFGALTGESDSLGRTTRYFYDTNFGYLLAVIMPNGEGTAYRYDDMGKLFDIVPATYNETTENYISKYGEEFVGYGYNSKNQLSTILTDTVTYTLNYDVFGNMDSVAIGNRTLADYEYEEENGKLSSMTYGNGCTVYYLYDELENLSELWYSYDEGETVTAAYSYTYGADGQLCRFDNLLTGKSTVYTYDSFGRLTGFAEYDTESMENTLGMRQTYTEQGQLRGVTYRAPYSYTNSNNTADWVAGYLYSYTAEGEDAGRLNGSSIRWGSSFHTILSTQYEYDPIGRLTTQTNTYGSGTSAFTSKIEYEYMSLLMMTSGVVSGYTSTFNGNESEYYYTYDANGNITQISLNGTVKYRYQYDNIGQLIREDNADMGKTYVYEYDDAGNILSKKTYPYTTAQTPSGTPVTDTYTYGDNTWGDLLTAYKGNNITYDEIGNPLVYQNGSSYVFTWTQGRRLATAMTGDSYMTFTYDDNGVRTGKIVDAYNYTYNVEGTRILSESWGTHLLVYLYDDSGLPTGMQYRNESYAEGVFDTFWFEKNLQGDVVAIYNNAGVKLASYIYDAWGNFTVTYTNGGAVTAAQYNPFTYRSYYYDDDLGLYYLNSRYYDSNTGRFINADVQINAKENFLGYNMYAYCGNNPVMYTDPSGCGKIWNWIKNTARDVGDWFSNTFGGAVYAANSYKAMTLNTIYWDVEQGISTSKVIAGDNSKPITFYVQNASEWWRFWEYKVGLNVNIGDGGFNVGLGAGDNTLTISAYNTSVEFVAGIMKLGVTVSEEVNFKNKTAGLYTQAYVRPWSMIGTAVVIYYSAGTLAPLFLSQLKPA